MEKRFYWDCQNQVKIMSKSCQNKVKLNNFNEKWFGKVEKILEQREVVFLSTNKVCKNLNFSTEIQIFANFSGW